MQHAKLLTILVEFNDEADDDFTDVMVPATVFESRACVAGNVQNGPLHNNIPNPATFSHADNNTFWVPDFSPAHFNKMLYTKDGHHRARSPGPDRPGWRRGHRHLRLHDEEHVRGDVQGRLHGRWRSHPVGHRPALGGLVRRIRLHP